jgi:membrane-associated phospholipid phosphatase
MKTTRVRSVVLSLLAASGALGVSMAASADEPAPSADAGTSPASCAAPAPSAAATSTEPITPAADPARKTDLEPKAAEPAPKRNTFDIDPLADGAVISVSLGFAGVLDLINSTGEIRPQQISPNFDRSRLLGIDRVAVAQHIDENAGTFSNIGLFAAAAFAVVDPILTGFREKNVQSALADATLYAESFSLAFAMANMVKMAVRRPRPTAYVDAELHKGDPSYSNADTDSSLSFFSGHASTVAAIGTTATYLAFSRAPGTVRPWITLVLAAGLSTFVSVERVRAGAHFPTDVIAGTVAGAGIGPVVPHLHRSTDIRQRRVWVGFSPSDRGTGGTAVLTGLF